MGMLRKHTQHRQHARTHAQAHLEGMYASQCCRCRVGSLRERSACCIILGKRVQQVDVGRPAHERLVAEAARALHASRQVQGRDDAERALVNLMQRCCRLHGWRVATARLAP